MRLIVWTLSSESWFCLCEKLCANKSVGLNSAQQWPFLTDHGLLFMFWFSLRSRTCFAHSLLLGDLVFNLCLDIRGSSLVLCCDSSITEVDVDTTVQFCSGR